MFVEDIGYLLIHFFINFLKASSQNLKGIRLQFMRSLAHVSAQCRCCFVGGVVFIHTEFQRTLVSTRGSSTCQASLLLVCSSREGVCRRGIPALLNQLVTITSAHTLPRRISCMALFNCKEGWERLSVDPPWAGEELAIAVTPFLGKMENCKFFL